MFLWLCSLTFDAWHCQVESSIYIPQGLKDFVSIFWCAVIVYVQAVFLMSWLRRMIKFASHKFWIQPIQIFKIFFCKNTELLDNHSGVFWLLWKDINNLLSGYFAVILGIVLAFFSNFFWNWRARKMERNKSLSIQGYWQVFAFPFDLVISVFSLSHLAYYLLFGIWLIYDYWNLDFCQFHFVVSLLIIFCQFSSPTFAIFASVAVDPWGTPERNTWNRFATSFIITPCFRRLR